MKQILILEKFDAALVMKKYIKFQFKYYFTTILNLNKGLQLLSTYTLGYVHAYKFFFLPITLILCQAISIQDVWELTKQKSAKIC